MSSVLSGVTASAAVDAVTPRLSGGVLAVYDDAQVLVQLQLGRPAFEKALGGEAVGRPIARGTVTAAGTPSRFVITDGQGVPAIFGTVGTDPDRDDLVFSQASFTPGEEVLITSARYVQERR